MARKASWFLNNIFGDPDEYICSRCKAVSRQPYDFCPECGSRMTFVWDDEEEDFWDQMEDMDEEDGF